MFLSYFSRNDIVLSLKDFSDLGDPLRILGGCLVIPRAVLDGEDVALFAVDLPEAGVVVGLVRHYHSLQIGNR